MSYARTTARLLHVAALPFPTHQGTQAVIKQMLEASTEHGRRPHLLTYAASGYPLTPDYALHRAGNFPRYDSLRSGPSLRKALLDARMIADCRALSRRLAPDLLVAHHVEAAAVSLSATNRPVLFFAHTDLGAELPSYGGSSRALGALGRDLDRFLSRHAAAVAAISPALQARLQRLCEERIAVSYIPPPWPVPRHASTEERALARAALALPADAEVLLYAGNLDGYQGWELLLEALSQLPRRHADTLLLFATESDPEPLRKLARALGLAARVRVSGIGDESERRRVHAAADLAVIPRRAPGGVPIKMLDAMARGLPCAVMPRATAGLKLEGVAAIAERDEASALAQAVTELLDTPARRRQLAERGRSYVLREHSARKFLDALDHCCELAMSAHGGDAAETRASWRGRTVPGIR